MGRKGRAPAVAAKVSSHGPSEAVDAMRESKPAGVMGFYSDRPGNPFREFSNFFRHERPFEFTLPTFAQREGFPRSVWCSFSEKAIMATKAALMGDLEIFMAIDKADDPKSCKALGRGVRDFDEALWQRHLEDTAFEVVRQKFESDRQLRELLLSTGNKILAEAAPNDCIWGIGLRLTDPQVKDPTQWRGRNILGYALMRTRDHLRGGSSANASANAAAPGAPVVVELASLPSGAEVEELSDANAELGGEVAADAGAADGAATAGAAAAAAAEAPKKSKRWGKQLAQSTD